MDPSGNETKGEALLNSMIEAGRVDMWYALLAMQAVGPYKWIAMDSTGYWHAYINKPRRRRTVWGTNVPETYAHLAVTPNLKLDWKESLFEIAKFL